MSDKVKNMISLELPHLFFRRLASPEFKYISFDNTIETVTGYPLPMLLNHSAPNYLSIIHIDEAEAVLNAVAEASLRKSSYFTQYRIEIKNGLFRNIIESGTRCFEDEEGRLVWEGMILVLEDKYKNLFENVPVGLYVTSSMEQIVDMNSQLMNIIGIEKKEEFRGRDILNLYVNPEDRIEWQKQLEASGSVQYLESKWRSVDGKELWVSENANLMEYDEPRA
ncbi:MAG: PAS domain-containing protein [Spirochaetales bacterium]|nr:PAS domain-containing protein [Spirochaetales bacterium]